MPPRRPVPSSLPPALGRPLDDRREAGRRLAVELGRLSLVEPLVLAIPRGGVPVGFEIAQRLGWPMDLLVVRKVGAPADPEYGLGAVGEDGVVVLDERRALEAGYRRADLEPVVRREQAEVVRRALALRGGRAPLPLTGRTAVIVDDGVATGGTVEAGVAVVRPKGPASVVVALGVAPAGTVHRLRSVADEVVVVLAPARFEAVGQWYRTFEPVDDAEVVRLLDAARARAPADAG